MKLDIRSGDIIDAIQGTYYSDNYMKPSPRHGGGGGKQHTIYFGDGEGILAVVGYYGYSKWCGNCVNQLAFLVERQDGTKHVVGPYGSSKGKLMIYPGYDGYVVSFNGRAGRYLDAIGFFTNG